MMMMMMMMMMMYDDASLELGHILKYNYDKI